MKQIAVVIPYYGEFNNYFRLWLQSIEKNDMIDFILVTDIDIRIELPSNIVLIRKSFEQLKKEIQELFEFKIALEKPYKLCEYRPVYGKVFSRQLSGYEFWGYCDMDTIFGKISDFLTTDTLEKYDVICSRGHFMLIRNNNMMNEMFKKKHSGTYYKKAFSSNISYHFDEWGGLSNIFFEKNVLMYDKIIFADIRYQKFEFRLAQGDFDNKKRIYAWEKGDLLEYALNNEGNIDTRKVMYIHLQKRSMEWDGNKCQRYIIYPNVIQGSLEKITKELIDKRCKKKIIYWHYVKIRFKYCINKLFKLVEEAFK